MDEILAKPLENAKFEVSEEESNLEEALKNQSLNAPKIIQKIVKLVLENSLPPELCERPADKLASYIKNASYYKKRRLAQKISKLEITTKVIICHALQRMEVTNFSLDICLSKAARRGKIKIGLMKFQKRPCLQTLAFGLNKHKRLGIGSDEERVDKLTPVEIPGEVVQVHMGEFHTIFEMKSGELYGCGRVSNFLEDASGSENYIKTPVKLPYFKNSSQVSPTIIMKDDSTRILNYTQNRTLVVGNLDPNELSKSRANGNNWMLSEMPNKIEEHRENKEAKYTTIEVESHRGEKRMIKISRECSWNGNGYRDLDIAFIVDGFRLDTEKLWKNYTVCSNGVIFALIDNNIYKGKFILAKRAFLNSDKDSSDEEVEYEMTGEDVEIAFLPREDVLLAVMEEVLMPVRIDGFTVSDDGESFIVWSKSDNDIKDEIELEPLEKFSQTEIPKNSAVQLERVPDLVVLDAKHLIEKFELECKNCVEAKDIGDLFLENGVAQHNKMIRSLLELKYFLRLDKTTKLPEVFINNFNGKDNSLNVDGIEREMIMAMKMGYRIPVMSVKADFTSSQSTQRKAEMKAQSLLYMNKLIDEVRELLTAYNNMPLKYRAHNLESKFGKFIATLIGHVGSLNLNPPENKSSKKQPAKIFKTNHCQEALKERIANRDIEGCVQEDSRWKAIRVEAVAFWDKTQQWSCGSNNCSYHMYTTKFHIQCIDETLVPFIDKNDVLSLNAACIDDDDSVRFQSLLDSFYIIRDDNWHLASFDRKIDVVQAATKLPAKDKYSITTEDGSVLNFPKVLFEVFSEYDAGRRRMAANQKNDADSFQLNFSADAIKLALACLIDVRVFYRADMSLKFEVYEICRFCFFSHIRPELLRMIILTVTEEYSNHIAKLVWEGPLEEIADLISMHRPDIILFWKNIPIQDNYLPFLDVLAKKMSSYHYKEFEYVLGDSSQLPMIAQKDEYTKREKINRKFALDYLGNKDQDGDIQWELMQTIISWDIQKATKRFYPFS